MKAEVVDYVLRKPPAETAKRSSRASHAQLASLDDLLRGEMDRAMMALHVKPATAEAGTRGGRSRAPDGARQGGCTMRRLQVRGWRTALAALGLAASASHAAPPQTVYRCGPEGRVYSQTPCADGKPVTIDDPRSASQQKGSSRCGRAGRAAGETAGRRTAQARGRGTGPRAWPASRRQRCRKRRPHLLASQRPRRAQANRNMSPPMRVPAASAAPSSSASFRRAARRGWRCSRFEPRCVETRGT